MGLIYKAETVERAMEEALRLYSPKEDKDGTLWKVLHIFHSMEKIEPKTQPVKKVLWNKVGKYGRYGSEFACSGPEGCGKSVYFDVEMRFCPFDFCPRCGKPAERRSDG